MNQGKSEPRLIYNQQTRRWEGNDGEWFIWMDDSTFQASVMAWLEGECALRSAPVQLREAVYPCSMFHYWENCERNYDQQVQKMFRGGMHP